MVYTPVLQSVGAAAIWGFAFIALRWTMQAIGPLWLSTLRFAAAFLFALPLIALVPSWRKALTHRQALLAVWPGITLGTCLALQARGLLLTSVAKSSFITVLYVVLVPIGEWVFLSRPVSGRHWFSVLMALAGSLLLGGWDSSGLNVGDLLTFGCAIMAALHFLALERIAPRVVSSFVTNVWQSLWACATVFPFALLLEEVPSTSHMTKMAVGSLAYLVFLSTMVAFMLQIQAQRRLRPSLVSLLCLLESPFAAIFAFFSLGERIMPVQAMGAALILVSSVMALAPWADRRSISVVPNK